MKKIYLGKDNSGNKVELDFDKERINFILLAGATQSGKTVFHDNLYKELLEKYSKDEIGFLFLDMTMVDFHDWPSDYLIKPIIYDREKAIKALDELTGLKTNKIIFVHIEECDMVHRGRKAVERAFMKLQSLKNIHIVYSTSRIDKEYLDDWMEKFVDLKVVFQVASEECSLLLLGNKSASQFEGGGERVLGFNNQRILCRPFSEQEIETVNKFFDTMTSIGESTKSSAE